MSKELMHSPRGEQQVYLVWEAVAGRTTLAVICTTDDDLSRYVTPDRKNWHPLSGKDNPVYVEKVLCDHLYGGNDLSIAMRIMRRS